MKLIGHVDFVITKHQHAPRPVRKTGLLGYKKWAADASLSECAHPDIQKLVVSCPDIEPVDADDHGCHLLREVPPGGGPWLDAADEALMVEANDHVLRVIEHGTGDQEIFSYVEGESTRDPLTVVEVLTVAQLEARAASLAPAARRLLAKPVAKRAYLWGRRDFIPTDQRRHVRRRDIRRQLVVAKHAIVNLLASSIAAEHLGTFDTVLRAGELKATARVSDSIVLAIAQRLLVPSRAAAEGTAQLRVMEMIMELCADRRRCLDPLVASFPFPTTQMAALSCFAQMRRDATDRNVLVCVIESEEHFFAILKFLAFHSPTALEPNAFMKAFVPTPAPGLLAQPDFFSRGKTPKTAFNAIYYHTVTQRFAAQLTFTQFNASKRVRGASLGMPPPEAPAQAKYDLLNMRWVSKDARAPVLGALKARFGGLLRWVFW